MSTSGLSPLDEAYGQLFAEELEPALRTGTAALEAQAADLAAASLVAEILATKGRQDVAGTAHVRLSGAWLRRGDFAGAAASAILAARAGEDASALRKELAKAFARGSKRARDDVSPAPPPLPARFDLDVALRKAKGDALLDRAEKALRAYLSTDDPVPEDAPVPKLPLASALAPASVERLLEAFVLRDSPTGESIVRQGTEGKAAYILVRGMAEAVRTAGDEEVRLAALGPGALFGEMALVSESPRAASVRALEPTRMLEVRRDDLEKLAQKDPVVGRELGEFCRMRMIANLLRHSAILGALAPGDREDLVARFDTRSFNAGESLVVEGKESEGIFLIASGAVDVSKKDADGDRMRLAELGPGDVVGEISLVLKRPATADVVARHATIALVLEREKFHQAIKDHPTLLNELYELATHREEETRSVVAQEALDVADVVLL